MRTEARLRRRCLNTSSCASPLRRPARRRCCRARSAISWCCAARPSRAMRCRHVGFTGATGAALFGLSPLAGLVGFSALAGLVMGLIGEKWSERDVAIGMTLSLALGSRPAVPAFLHLRRGAGDGAAVWQRARRRRDGADDAAGAGRGEPAGARLDRPAAHLREPAGGACGGAGIADARALGRLPRDRRGGGRRKRADRRRAAGVHADGRPRRGVAQTDAQRRRRRGARRGAGARAKPGAA